VLGPLQQRLVHIGNDRRAEVAVLAPVPAQFAPDLQRPAQAPIDGQHARRHFDEKRCDAFAHAMAPHLNGEIPEEDAAAAVGFIHRQHRDMSGAAPGPAIVGRPPVRQGEGRGAPTANGTSGQSS